MHHLNSQCNACPFSVGNQLIGTLTNSTDPGKIQHFIWVCTASGYALFAGVKMIFQRQKYNYGITVFKIFSWEIILSDIGSEIKFYGDT